MRYIRLDIAHRMSSYPPFSLSKDAPLAGAPALSPQLQRDLTAFLAKRGGKRLKLWELASNLHCSVIGTCLDTAELRRLVSRCVEGGVSKESDHVVHGEAVLMAGQKSDAAKLLHKALDSRHEATIKAFDEARDAVEIGSLWERAKRGGDIPGAYWAILTHPATTDDLMRSVFGDVHMLSHLVGSANRAEIGRLAALEQENAELELKVYKQQDQLREVIAARDEAIKRVEAATISKSSSVASDADENAALRARVVELRERISVETGRREQAERRLEKEHTVLSETAAALRQAVEREHLLRERLEAAEMQMTLEASDGVCTAPVDLGGTRLLYVGGRTSQIHHIRAVAEQANAKFVHHDGGTEERK